MYLHIRQTTKLLHAVNKVCSQKFIIFVGLVIVNKNKFISLFLYVCYHASMGNNVRRSNLWCFFTYVTLHCLH